MRHALDVAPFASCQPAAALASVGASGRVSSSGAASPNIRAN
jgi:hypothetical protein